MTANGPIQAKSYAFAVRVVKLYQYLSAERKEFTLSRQLLRSGTSIGANVEEGIGGQSRADFFSKLSIAYKEARETAYWLRLLRDTDYLTESNSTASIPMPRNFADSSRPSRILPARKKPLTDFN